MIAESSGEFVKGADFLAPLQNDGVIIISVTLANRTRDLYLALLQRLNMY